MQRKRNVGLKTNTAKKVLKGRQNSLCDTLYNHRLYFISSCQDFIGMYLS
ncbi:hypothetical protein Barb6_00929 [Bacteroidales bacterium Barb6]|nr:hypothetical protein Barb6_00929 [Bacteroidales bacterium Barb6]